MTRIHVASSSDALGLDAAEMVVQMTTTAAHARGRCTVALAGGATPRRLYRALAHSVPLRDRVPWSRIEFFWSDERHVPPDDPQSNYGMAYDAMLSAAPVRAEQIHRIKSEHADAAAVAGEYEDEIRAAFGRDEVPRFDVILLGLGVDGHMASLFPGTAALRESSRLCVENWVPALGAYRITMTLTLLNCARAVVVLVSGADKSAIVRQVLRRTSGEPLPAHLLQPDGDIVWMLDRAAASGLLEVS